MADKTRRKDAPPIDPSIIQVTCFLWVVANFKAKGGVAEGSGAGEGALLDLL